MTTSAERSTSQGELGSLIYELLDAHADTVEFAHEQVDPLRWEAHIDYLRALSRRGNEILARSWQATAPGRPEA